MVKSMVAALFRKPASRILPAFWSPCLAFGTLVNEELRTEVQGR